MVKAELMHVWEHVGEMELAKHLTKDQQHMKHCLE